MRDKNRAPKLCEAMWQFSYVNDQTRITNISLIVLHNSKII